MDPSSATSPANARKLAQFFGLALTVAALDQATKWVIRTYFDFGEGWSPGGVDFVRIVHLTNSGAAFGILQGETQFLIVTSVLGIAAIMLFFLYPPMDHLLVRVALAMQLGGALGNFIDRIFRGEVTDWIDVGAWPTFNLADSSITLSIFTMFAFLLLVEGSNRTEAPVRPNKEASDAGAPDD